MINCILLIGKNVIVLIFSKRPTEARFPVFCYALQKCRGRFSIVRFLLLFGLLVSLVTPTFAADFTELTSGIEFVRIKGGVFDMGDTTHTGYEFERPLHQVNVKEFFMGTYEVTLAQYDKFASETNRPLPDDAGWGRDNRPVINVSWEDATAYAAWLSGKSGRRFRLPTEAEWEYAARAGSNTAYWWGNEVGRGNANCNGCGSRWDNPQTAPVGSFTANRFGLYDMHGNVSEWVADRRHDSYQGAPADGSAWVDGTSADRVQRGGSFRDFPKDIKASTRNWANPSRKQIDCGFRLVMEEK
ncbi:MAG: formylglycine-generating enzyme family protein [Desulfuromonas sp.]|nr:formylglycine-generating enzyme family protein [Desulfuromonas sp.]